MVPTVSEMIKLLQAARELQDVCAKEGWQYCFIGGLALQRWGEPRVTQDVDLTLLTGFGSEETFIRTLLKHFSSRRPDAGQFALKSRVLLLLSSQGIGMDIALAGFPFEELAVQRASHFDFLPGVLIRTCSAEDLIIFKTFADRPQDWVDVEGVLVRQSGRLDWRYIMKHLKPLVRLKEAPEILKHLQKLRVDCQ